MTRNVQKYVDLDSMDSDALEQLLQQSMETPGSIDEDTVSHILDLLEEREKVNPSGQVPDIDEAWQRFQRYYNTPEGKDLSLYAVTEPKEKKQGPALAPILRICATIAATIAIVFFVICPVFGYENLFQLLGLWTDEFFHFSTVEPSSVESPDHANLHEPGEYQDIQEALDDYGITYAVVPAWMPDGYTLSELDVAINMPKDGSVDFFAGYNSDDGNIALSYTLHASPGTYIYMKDTTPVETYIVNGIAHYVFQNNGQVVTAWYVDDMECAISGDITPTELKRMIDSIY